MTPLAIFKHISSKNADYGAAGSLSHIWSDIRPPEIEIELEKEIEIEKEREGETGHPAPAAYGRYNNVILTDTELPG